ncbi:MAG TPA: HAMP domain-containing sensor histidine kinase [Gemmatimonadaceae bacterium]|nr:HAMP domain-containing sensor histidine kinase [Gemmatimonadaceae bacterium]
MSFRSRILLAFLVVVLVPMAVLAIGVRREMDRRLTAQYEQRMTGLVSVITEELAQENSSIAGRLSSLAAALTNDNRFRLAALRTPNADRAYLLDYAGHAMRLAGLSMLQIQDSAGRIVSSGHFRNEYDRLEPTLPAVLATAPRGMAIVKARAPTGPFLAIARTDSFRLAGERFTVTGGIRVGSRFLAQLARGHELAVTLLAPRDTLSSDPRLLGDSSWRVAASSGPGAHAASADFMVDDLTIPYIDTGREPSSAVESARLLVSYPLGPLTALRRSVDLWFLTAVGLTLVIALLLGMWLSARVSRPLAELASKTARIDLDAMDVDFASNRSDEIGALSRLLGAMTRRLRASASKLREAERRATVGEVARQVNHDIKNGLTPIRNVFRHLAQVAREQPSELPAIFQERQGTLESSIAYLDSLARNYARLAPRLDREPCDVNAVVQQVIRNAQAAPSAELRVRLAEGVSAVLGDEVVVRRILENLVGNAVDSLELQPGSVTVSTEMTQDASHRPMVRITVADTGRGMSEQQLSRAFDDFYTTKDNGTGLGLSVVRRLVLDLSGSLKVDTAPRAGTRFMVDLPARAAAPLHGLPTAPVGAKAREKAR